VIAPWRLPGLAPAKPGTYIHPVPRWHAGGRFLARLSPARRGPFRSTRQRLSCRSFAGHCRCGTGKAEHSPTLRDGQYRRRAHWPPPPRIGSQRIATPGRAHSVVAVDDGRRTRSARSGARPFGQPDLALPNRTSRSVSPAAVGVCHAPAPGARLRLPHFVCLIVGRVQHLLMVRLVELSETLKDPSGDRRIPLVASGLACMD